MIKVDNLTKRFGRHSAVSGATFAVEQGEVVGFLGPNGAGKTTTIRMLTGFLPPSSGSASIDGLDVNRHSLEARRQIGYLPESVPLYRDMRVREYLRFRGQLKGLSGNALRARMDEVIERSAASRPGRCSYPRSAPPYSRRTYQWAGSEPDSCHSTSDQATRSVPHHSSFHPHSKRSGNDL